MQKLAMGLLTRQRHTLKFFFSLLVLSQITHAQILIEDPTRGRTPSRLPGALYAEDTTTENVRRVPPATGKSAATEYFKARNQSGARAEPVREVTATGERILSLHMGSFINDKQYRWGRDK